MGKKLYKSSSDKMIAGVCGGIADYLNIDSTIVRVLTAIFFFGTMSTGIVIYIILALLLSYEKDVESFTEESKEEKEKKTKFAIGIGLILYGLYLTIDRFFYYIDIKDYLPIGLVLLGIYLIVKGRGGNNEKD